MILWMVFTLQYIYLYRKDLLLMELFQFKGHMHESSRLECNLHCDQQRFVRFPIRLRERVIDPLILHTPHMTFRKEAFAYPV